MGAASDFSHPQSAACMVGIACGSFMCCSMCAIQRLHSSRVTVLQLVPQQYISSSWTSFSLLLAGAVAASASGSTLAWSWWPSPPCCSWMSPPQVGLRQAMECWLCLSSACALLMLQ